MKTRLTLLLSSFMLLLSACASNYYQLPPGTKHSTILYTGDTGQARLYANKRWQDLQTTNNTTCIPTGKRLKIRDTHTTDVPLGYADEFITYSAKLSFLPLKTQEYLLDFNLVNTGCKLNVLTHKKGSQSPFRIDDTVVAVDGRA
jgi:hypothetical protein